MEVSLHGVLQSPNVTLTQDMGDLVEDKTLPPMLSQEPSVLKRPRQRKLARGDVKYNIPDLGLRCDTPAARWYRENRTRIDEEYPLGTWMRVLMMGKLYGMVPNFWKDLSNILAVSSLVWGLDRTVLPRIWTYALPVLIPSIVIRHGLPFAQI